MAIIAAADEKTALMAMSLIKVEYEVWEPVLDFEKAAGHASIVHPEDDLHCNFDIGMQRERNIASAHKVEAGNVEEEFKNVPW